MSACSFLQIQFSYKEQGIFLLLAISKILIQWLMGHSGDDVIHKTPHKMRTRWPNQLQISVLVYRRVLYRTRFKKLDVILNYIFVQCHSKTWYFSKNKRENQALKIKNLCSCNTSNALILRNTADVVVYVFLCNVPIPNSKKSWPYTLAAWLYTDNWTLKNTTGYATMLKYIVSWFIMFTVAGIQNKNKTKLRQTNKKNLDTHSLFTA